MNRPASLPCLGANPCLLRLLSMAFPMNLSGARTSTKRLWLRQQVFTSGDAFEGEGASGREVSG
jgi:hypothetical protein